MSSLPGAAGIGLNDANMITVPGPSGTLAGLRVWDKIVKIDDVATGSRTLMATMVELKPKRSHTLTVLRKQELASHPVPTPEISAAPQGWRLVPSGPVRTPAEEATGARLAVEAHQSAGDAPAVQTAAVKPEGSMATAVSAAAARVGSRVSRAPPQRTPPVSPAATPTPAASSLYPVVAGSNAFSGRVEPLVPLAPLPPIMSSA